MGILDWIRGRFSSSENEQGSQQGPEILTISSPELLMPTMVPKHVVRRAWALIEKDAALTYITEKEMRWLQYKVMQIAEFCGILAPEVYHPDIVAMHDRLLNALIDEVNTELLGYLRLKRSMYGFERRATFYPAR